MAYTRRQAEWKNYPDTTTPIRAEDLNAIEAGLQASAGVADTALALASDASIRIASAETVASGAAADASTASAAASSASATASAAAISASAASSSAAQSAASAANLANLVNAPADSAIATAVNGSGTQTQAALDARFKTLDPLAGLVMKLDQRQPSAVIAVLGDSTGVPPTTGTWVGNLATKIGAKWPACKVTTRVQSGVVYPAPTTFATGVLTKTSTDTFTRTAADLIGSTATTGGGVWTSTSSGKYTVDGSKALFTNGATGVTAHRLPVGAGRHSVQADLTFVQDGGAHNGKTFNMLAAYVDSANFLWLTITTAVTPTITLKKSTTAGGTVTLGTLTAAAAGITNAIPPQTKTLKIEHVGLDVTFTVGAAAATYTLSQADSDLFKTGTQVGIWGTADDHSWDNLTAVSSTDPATVLDIYNGSASSTDATWPTGAAGRLAALLPVAPDVVFINYGHNHLTESPATFEGKIDTLVAAIRALYASTPIVIVGQNPQFPPAVNRTYHNAREQDKRRYAKAKGFGYLGAYEAIQGQDFPSAYVQADGVHPTTSGTEDGGMVWATAADTYLKSISLKP